MLRSLKRYLYLSHRWLGIALCAFMAMWFVSGVVMMYVGYPKLTPAEKLAGLPELMPERCCVSFTQAIIATGETKAPDSVRVTSVSGVPRYIFGYGKQQVAVDAESGKLIVQVSPRQALAAARDFLSTPGGYYLDSVSEDAWTHSKALDHYRPLHRIQMDDAHNTLLYVSEITGEVVRDATSTERFWNWFGAWIHWLYPFRGGSLDNYAHDIVVYTSLAGSVLTLLGMVVGIMRWRFRRHYQHGDKTPYRAGWMRWHHLLGLGFGIIAFTWILSGLFSVNPWKIFESDAAKLNVPAYMGGEFMAQYFPLPVSEALTRFREAGLAAREVEWRLLNGQGYYVGFDSQGHSRILLAQADSPVIERFSWRELQDAGRRLMGDGQLDRQNIVSEYDFYYYSRAAHTMTGHIEKRLPILRMEFGDSAATWLHLDPYTGSFSKLDNRKRASRWLFALLHSWDWLPLLNSRPFWDIILIAFSSGGLMISISGIVVGWRRLERIRSKPSRGSSKV